MPATHEVLNTVEPLVGFDTAAPDPALAAGLAAAGTALTTELHELAVDAGSAEYVEHARLAEGHHPVLHTHDRAGHRVDEVEYHPSWHALMTRAVGAGLQAAPWAPDAHAHAHVQRAAGFYLWTQTDSGHMCPISMTYAAIPALRHDPALARQFEPGLRSRSYDFGLRRAATKRGLLAGMSMTEKQGGSDVRAATTVAAPGPDGYRLTGHKWFTSAPMNDLFLTLAQAPGGLTCFVVPRVLPDGARNAIRLMRLKDKLGNRSNASSEIEYDGALGWRLGDEGRGVATILEMVTMTRLDCVLGSAGQVRAGLSQAAFYAARRQAFGRRLVEHEPMAAVLADLAVESWAATLTGLRLAALVDAGTPEASMLLRIALPAAKFWTCKRAVPVLAEALECLGGNGYVEESGMPRLFRESPLMSIWEGSGNVAALDALRAMTRQPETVEAFFTEVGLAQGADPRLDDAIARVGKELSDTEDIEYRARRVVELMALVLQGAQLVRHGHPAVADAFCASRLVDDWGVAMGTLPTGVDVDAVLARVLPE